MDEPSLASRNRAASWRLSAKLSPKLLPAMEEGLLALGGAVVVGGRDEAGSFPLEAHFAARPDDTALAELATEIAVALGDAAPAFTLEELAPRDWVAESQTALPPLRIGRFHIYGVHDKAPPPGLLALRVEAATAFGTGRHGSTAGCLTALTLLARNRHPHRRVLDLGCGTAVLAMAAARLWPCVVVAVDNDKGSVLVARENLRTNGLAARIRVLQGDGLKPASVRRAAPYDLILANILAGPLLAMARDLARRAAPGGSVILAGLLRGQERRLVARYRTAGLVLVGTLRFGEWSTLMLRRRRDHPGRAPEQRDLLIP